MSLNYLCFKSNSMAPEILSKMAHSQFPRNHTCDGPFTYLSTFRYNFRWKYSVRVGLCAWTISSIRPLLSSAQSRVSFKFMNDKIKLMKLRKWNKKFKWKKENEKILTFDIKRRENSKAEHCFMLRSKTDMCQLSFFFGVCHIHI